MNSKHGFVFLLIFCMTACGGGSGDSSTTNNNSSPTTDLNIDSEFLPNKLLSLDDPGYAGLFNLGPDDYFSHTSKMGEAPSLVHIFYDWFDEDSLSNVAEQEVIPRPIDFNDFRNLNFVFEPDTIIAFSWAMPLPNFDVEGRHYQNIPKVQDILDGKFDQYIREFAQAIALIDLPVMLTLFGEIDNNAFYSFGPEGLNSAFPDPDIPQELDVPATEELYEHYGDANHPDGPERVRDAFIHVINIFEEENVTSPSWFMYGSSGFMSTESNETDQQLVNATEVWNQAQWYYPGDEYIDWVGKSLHHSDIDDLKNQLELAYNEWGKVTLRPFFSPEFSIQLKDSSRASQIREEFSTFLTGFARFKAFAIVDQDPLSGSDEFGLSTLGGVNGEFFDEIEAWRDSVIDNEKWLTIPVD